MSSDVDLEAAESAVEVPGAGVAELFDLAWAPAQHFAQMLAEEGELRGLIGPRELPRLWSRHIVNSAAVAQFVSEDDSVVDVGSGAGFPGVVVAMLRPDAAVHLVEPMERRVDWLHDVVDELGLDNVEIHRARAEEMHGVLKASVVTARAVAALDRLSRWTMPLVAGGGRLVALKGERASIEVEKARKVLRKLGAASTTVESVTPVPGGESTTVVVVNKR
ncbi:16S rRNA (guanine(527)-N(7))-methyltransferase RsmG [Georgenia sp. Z1344]|uniref:16S rRNA (guanine(527)-N(7))-methyltransferase RsmG n=1 Tax=Georgenia sp. Z1344 TaxID=3416706 RepID=UPI003CFA3543